MGPPEGVDQVPTPALLFFPDRIESNLARLINLAGGYPRRLRLHMKTHKCGEILHLQQRHGLDRVKCATLAEVKLALDCGIGDVLLAYPPTGPALQQLLQLQRLHPHADLAAIVDDPARLSVIGEAVERNATRPLSLFIDIDMGMGRTGIAPGGDALALVRMILGNSRLVFGGIHAYDGHIQDSSVPARRAVVYRPRRAAESSLMAKGIYAGAARESEAVTG